MTEPGRAQGTDEARSPSPRTGLVLAAAFLGCVAVLGTVIAVASDPDDGSPAGAATAEELPDGPPDGDPPPAAGPDDGGAPDEDAAPCPELPDAAPDVPTSAPEGVTWELYRTVALPASAEAGPAVVERDVARCYAPTPVGALLAASQIGVRYLAADDWRRVTETQTVGAGRDAYLAGRSAAEPPDAPAPGGGAAHGQIAGFRFVSYAETAAEIETVWRFPEGQLQAATTTVLWRDGDWRLEFPADPAPPTPVDSLAGYVPWGGV